MKTMFHERAILIHVAAGVIALVAMASSGDITTVQLTKQRFKGRVTKFENSTARSVIECAKMFSYRHPKYDTYWFDAARGNCIMAKSNPGMGVTLITAPDYVYKARKHKKSCKGGSGIGKGASKKHKNSRQ